MFYSVASTCATVPVTFRVAKLHLSKKTVTWNKLKHFHASHKIRCFSTRSRSPNFRGKKVGGVVLKSKQFGQHILHDADVLESDIIED